jgi:hypothetical protein
MPTLIYLNASNGILEGRCRIFAYSIKSSFVAKKAKILHHKGTKDTKKNFVSFVPLW